MYISISLSHSYKSNSAVSPKPRSGGPNSFDEKQSIKISCYSLIKSLSRTNDRIISSNLSVVSTIPRHVTRCCCCFCPCSSPVQQGLTAPTACSRQSTWTPFWCLWINWRDTHTHNAAPSLVLGRSSAPAFFSIKYHGSNAITLKIMLRKLRNSYVN